MQKSRDTCNEGAAIQLRTTAAHTRTGLAKSKEWGSSKRNAEKDDYLRWYWH